MKKQYIYSALILAAALFAGCAKEIENTIDGSDSSAIELSSVSTDPMTKAVITGTEFTTTEAEKGIGLFLLDANGKAYGSNEANVKYTFSSSKWTASQPLRIGNTKGTLVGYYPYSEGATNVKAIPVASSINGTDWLYGSIAEITSAKAKTESLTLSHALTRLRITFKRDASFVGSGTLSSLTIEGNGIAAEGTLDATTGKVSADKTPFTVSTLNETITEEGITEDCLVVPAASSAIPQAVTLKFTVDGTAYKVELKDNLAVKLQSGIQTDITLTVKNTSVSVDGSSIGACGDGGSQTVTVGGNYTVTIRLADNVAASDIFIDTSVDGNSVNIITCSKSGQHLKCTMPDGEFCTSQSKTSNLVYTFNISDITKNTTATIGYANSTSIAISPANSGIVEIEGANWENHFEGETYKHKAIPNEGYFFVNWQDQYGNILCESEEYTFRPSSKVDVTAVFQRYVFFSLKIFVCPSFAGSVSAFENSNVIGTEITLTTTPCGNSVFNGWKDKDGNILSIDNTYTFTIESDTILIADYSVDCGTDALNGVFTVAEDNGYGKPKKVRFSKGNLYCSGASFDESGSCTSVSDSHWLLEQHQYDYGGNWDGGNRVSHFIWNKNCMRSLDKTYDGTGASGQDVFFTNSVNFAVNGVSAWHTLTAEEWAYLLGNREERSGKYKTEVTVNGIMGLVIAPDNFNGTISDEYDASEWATAESNDNLVFLPAAGFRYGNNVDTDVYDAGFYGYYWSASPADDNNLLTFYLGFSSSNVHPFRTEHRTQAFAVRLVTECQSEPSAE